LTTPLPGSQLYEDCRRSGIVGDEDEYLSRISRGYFYNEDVIVNLTSLTDDELLDLKYAAQEVMMENHLEWLRSQGRIAAARRMWKTLQDMYYFEGTWPVVKQVVRKAGRILERLIHGGRRSWSFWGALYPESLRTDYVYRTHRAVDFKQALKAPAPSPESIVNRDRIRLELMSGPTGAAAGCDHDHSLAGVSQAPQ
jgi:hypothetical protein